MRFSCLFYAPRSEILQELVLGVQRTRSFCTSEHFACANHERPKHPAYLATFYTQISAEGQSDARGTVVPKPRRYYKSDEFWGNIPSKKRKEFRHSDN